jgi:hypothetical protein
VHLHAAVEWSGWNGIFGIFHEKSVLLFRRMAGVHDERVRVDCMSVLQDLGPSGEGRSNRCNRTLLKSVPQCRGLGKLIGRARLIGMNKAEVNTVSFSLEAVKP